VNISERNSDTGQLDYWDELLAVRAVFIIKERFKATREMEQIAIKNHRKLTDDNEIIQFIYRPAIDPVNSNTREELPSKEFNSSIDQMTNKEFKMEFLRQLKLRRKEEISRGITTIGPHRDEMRFLSNQLDLGDFGSRGQVRTALLSLKLAEVEWMHQRTTFRPILLLDETMAELDQIRRSKLLESIIEGHQTILTTTDLKLFDRDFVKKASLWHISQGIVEDTSAKSE
jgi:DNA replication and repair protein RecF